VYRVIGFFKKKKLERLDSLIDLIKAINLSNNMFGYFVKVLFSNTWKEIK